MREGSRPFVDVHAQGGAAGTLETLADGRQRFVPFTLQQVRRAANIDGTYRWYGTWALPDDLGGGTVTLNLVGTHDDKARRLNRTEHLRAFPPGSKQYKKIYGRRADAESANRQIDDGLYLRRAGSFGRQRNLIDLYCHATAVNAIAITRHRARGQPTARAA